LLDRLAGAAAGSSVVGIRPSDLMLRRSEKRDPVLGEAKARRESGRGRSAYLIEREITRTLAAARDRYLSPGTRILDVGCRVAPYKPLFDGIAAQYDGTDIEPGPFATYICQAESLDGVEDGSYDLVLCTQVLHLVRRPEEALAEFARVLATGGYVFLTTHGVYPHHPDPKDYWRWTQQGLPALFEDVPGLELLELVPHGGSATTMAIMVNTPIRQAARAAGSDVFGAPLIALVNLVGGAIDRVLPSRAKAAMIPNFLVVARRTTVSATA
jgi:SAM-dependent methyltransferase